MVSFGKKWTQLSQTHVSKVNLRVTLITVVPAEGWRGRGHSECSGQEGKSTLRAQKGAAPPGRQENPWRGVCSQLLREGTAPLDEEVSQVMGHFFKMEPFPVAQTVKNLPAMPPTPVFLPGEFHGQRSLAGYSPWGRKESDTTEWLTVSLKWSRLQTPISPDDQRGPTVQHRELYWGLSNNLHGKRIWKRTDTCVCINDSLCCTSERNTTLLINYAPKQKFKINK